jgi:hypothetical protein
VEAAAFKLLYTTMLTKGSLPDKLKKPIKCYVKESSPYFLVTDDFFYVPCYFTKKAVDSCKGLSSMQGKVITISDWSLEMCKVKSDQVFTSYAGVEIRFVVNSVSATASGSDSIALSRQPVNIYRDSEIKALINKCVWDAQMKTVSAAGLPDISKMAGKGNVAAGIVKCADAKVAGMKAPTPTVAVGGGKKSAVGKAIKPKVAGGAKTKIIKKASKGASVAKKLMKSTPGGKMTTGRKTAAKLGDSSKGTTDVGSMRQFQKLMKKHKASKKSK